MLLATALLALAAFLAPLVALRETFFAAFILECHYCLLRLSGPITHIESSDCVPRKFDCVVLAERLLYYFIIGLIAKVLLPRFETWRMREAEIDRRRDAITSRLLDHHEILWRLPDRDARKPCCHHAVIVLVLLRSAVLHAVLFKGAHLSY